MSSKVWPLIALVVVIFAGAIIDGGTRYSRNHGTVTLVHSLVTVGVIYWWYVLDKRERQFKAGMLQNMGIIVFAPLGLAVYFFRSRQLKSAALLTVAMMGILLGLGFVFEAGESIGLRSAF